MERKIDFTVHEHYIPRVLLRGFSPNYNAQRTEIKKKNLKIWRYDCKAQNSVLVPEDSVCREDNLYESTGKDGEFVFRNHIEKKLSAIEMRFECFRTMLEKKAFNEVNLNTSCFLSKDEKDFWVLYIAHQILRTPEVIGEASLLAQSFSDKELTKEQAKNLALLFCTPYYRPMDDGTPEAKTLVNLMIPMRGLDFRVAVSSNGKFVTSDKAVFVMGNVEKNCLVQYELILFPISAFLCLVLSKRGSGSAVNRLFRASGLFERELFQALQMRSNVIFSRNKI